MKTLFLACMLIGSCLQADDTKKFSEIEAVLKGDATVRIATAEDANKLLFSEIGKPTGGISAYWSWSIRDAFMLPSDWEGIGKAGEVVWIGQLNSLDGAPFASQPLALYYINANSGKIFTLKRQTKKKAAEQAAPSNGG
jgi:hypothetical protein